MATSSWCCAGLSPTWAACSSLQARNPRRATRNDSSVRHWLSVSGRGIAARFARQSAGPSGGAYHADDRHRRARTGGLRPTPLIEPQSESRPRREPSPGVDHLDHLDDLEEVAAPRSSRRRSRHRGRRASMRSEVPLRIRLVRAAVVALALSLLLPVLVPGALLAAIALAPPSTQ